MELTESKAIFQKVKGVAGSGKTTVLVRRAVNAYRRTGSNVLILTFNITLKNYLHDQISKIRDDIPWNNFHIVNYHQFFKSTCNNLNLVYCKEDFDNEYFFDQVDTTNQKYSAIFIDEIQDYKIEWQRIIRNNFLTPNGELVMYGDEKQNIYGRELEEHKSKTIIPGAWNVLGESYRLSNRVSEIASVFQEHFLANTYEKDIIQSQFDFDASATDQIRYFYTDQFELNHAKSLYTKFEELLIPPNDICFLAANVEILQKYDQFIRHKRREKTTTMFEKLEDNERLKKTMDLSTFNKIIYRIQRSKKANFWMNAGTTKLSTIHSFKGWEIDNLVLIIEKDYQNEERILFDELIYTGLTRCKRNLFIINYGNLIYNEFFEGNRRHIDYMDTNWN